MTQPPFPATAQAHSPAATPACPVACRFRAATPPTSGCCG